MCTICNFGDGGAAVLSRDLTKGILSISCIQEQHARKVNLSTLFQEWERMGN
jgi:hypothetical protein